MWSGRCRSALKGAWRAVAHAGARLSLGAAEAVKDAKVGRPLRQPASAIQPTVLAAEVNRGWTCSSSIQPAPSMRPGRRPLSRCDRASDHPDNWRRFAALSQGRCAMIAQGAMAARHPQGWKPDIVHVHDWQAALVPAYMRYRPDKPDLPTVMTIHNIAFQGQFGADMFPDLALPAHAFSIAGRRIFRRCRLT
jgi:hypothetical protein